MDFYVKKVAIESLTPSRLSAFCNQKNRYNCVTDLVLKGKSQIEEFSKRTNQLYRQLLKERHPENNVIKQKDCNLKAYLSVVFCKAETQSESEALPIYEFLSFEVVRQGWGSSSGFGVMLSTYTHDLDREKIEKYSVLQDPVNISVELWNSLFEKTSLNKEKDPLFGKYPVLVFPQEKAKIGLPSATNDYMKRLGLEMLVERSLYDDPMRIFYRKSDPQMYNSEIYLAILAIGQVFLEMTNPHIYRTDSQLMPFNRDNFTKAVKLQQKNTFTNWLFEHGLLEMKNQNSDREILKASIG